MKRFLLPLLLIAVLLGWLAPARAQTRLRNICRVKGQEENQLVGLGLVVGLRGTGDTSDYLPTIRSLARALELMGSPLGKKGLEEITAGKNAALVMVTATVPKQGARQGDRLNCTVSSIGSAKSLAGGRLFLTPMLGPRPQADPKQKRVYGFAQGPVQVDPQNPTTGRIYRGLQLEADFFHPFIKDGKLTLVIDPHRAGFELAQEIASTINNHFSYEVKRSDLARAINASNIEVEIPQVYRREPVQFVALLMSLPLDQVQTEARVVINQQTGSIVISGDVQISPAVITHRNIVVETTGGNRAGQFVAVAPQDNQPARLQSLLQALNAIKVPPEDTIEIIKALHRNGSLHGWLVIE